MMKRQSSELNIYFKASQELGGGYLKCSHAEF